MCVDWLVAVCCVCLVGVVLSVLRVRVWSGFAWVVFWFGLLLFVLRFFCGGGGVASLGFICGGVLLPVCVDLLGVCVLLPDLCVFVWFFIVCVVLLVFVAACVVCVSSVCCCLLCVLCYWVCCCVLRMCV